MHPTGPAQNSSATNVPAIDERQLFIKRPVRSPEDPEHGFGGDTYQELMPTRHLTQAELAELQAEEAVALEKKMKAIEDAMAIGRDAKILRFEAACLAVPWELYKREPRPMVDNRTCSVAQDRLTAKQAHEETAELFAQGISMLKEAGIIDRWEPGMVWGQDSAVGEAQGQTPSGVQNSS